MLKRAFHLAQMMRNERRAPARLVAEQDRRLRALVRHAAERVPFYRRLYADHGIDTASFSGLDDLGSLPIIDKQLLRAAGTGAESADAPPERVTISTSGSSGAIFAFRIDRGFDTWRKAQYLRPYLTNGRRITDRVLRLTAFPRARPPWFTALGLLQESQVSCAADPADVVDRWQRLAPRVLQGYPSSLRALAHHCLERGISLHPAPQRIFTDSELLTPDTRRLIERAFGTRVTDVFGTYETDNIAYQCEHGHGYHVALDCVVLEVVRNGQPAAPGESGELVVTVLRNRTTPFIRYNLRDIIALATSPCPCGRSLPLLRVIEGRADDQIRLPDGRERSPLALLGRLDALGALLKEFQVEQTSTGDFEVRVVPSAAFDADAPRRIEQLVRDELPGASVRVVALPMIARSGSGKFKAFVARSHDP
jgi:phenylacetate-CoA ligase